MSSEAISLRIARRLKALRTERGWSLDSCSKHTKVSKAMLGQIERGESNPTISILWKIATGFQVSFSSFLVAEGTQLPEPQELFSNPDHLGSIADHQGMRVETLFPFSPDVGMETLRVTLSPNHVQKSLPHDAGVIEHIIVLAGELKLSFERESVTLTQGQTIRFNADQPHSYSNCSIDGGLAQFHNIICYPSI